MMKTALVIVLVLSFLLIGCDDINDLLNRNNQDSYETYGLPTSQPSSEGDKQRIIPPSSNTEGDKNSDIDNDRIPDYLDSNNQGKSGNIIKLSWTFDCEGATTTVVSEVDQDWYNYRKNMDHTGLSKKDFADMSDPLVRDIAKLLNVKVDWQDLRLEHTMVSCFMVATKIGEGKGCDGYDDHPKFPVETLVEGKGDSEDTGLLAAAILQQMGVDSAVLYIKGVNKQYPDIVGAGVFCPGCGEGAYYRSGGATNKERKQFYFLGHCGAFQFGKINAKYENQLAEVIDI
ncbi:hypothetical protein FJZ53_06060 [Candidatus Woesearchaeota archaeon]|nr:hypothetical protein [Candidatus Woesearchaeota archaeon]